MLTHNLATKLPAFKGSVEERIICLKVCVAIAEKVQIFNHWRGKAKIRPLLVVWDEESVLHYHLLLGLLKRHIYPFIRLLQAPVGETAELNTPNATAVVDRNDCFLHGPFVRKVLVTWGQLQGPLNLVLCEGICLLRLVSVRVPSKLSLDPGPSISDLPAKLPL